MNELPVGRHLPTLLGILEEGRDLVLSAPPGGGKSTLVPPALLEQGWCSGRVLVSQPRRIAAQALARRVAQLRGCKVGAEIGYSVRFDRRVSDATRLEFLTAGLLLRRLQNDPFLDGVSAVVLDEFHERSLDTDLALALLLQVKAQARSDLRLIVMSATLDADPLLKAMPDAALIEAEGRQYPVTIEHQRSSDKPLFDQVATAAARAIKAQGKVLAFLPGVGDIERCGAKLIKGCNADVLPLHGRLSKAEQARALDPNPHPAIVLATTIAQTSLTIEGVHTVIDSGLAKRPLFDARLGLTRLSTLAISRASADQRSGRAGRTGPGHCLRLWSSAEHQQRRQFDAAEIADADLCSAFLQILSWGEDPQTFKWFERPPEAHLAAAAQLLRDLGACDASMRLTPLGRQLAELPVHPRLGRMLIEAKRLRQTDAGAALAALVSQGDFLRHNPPDSIGDDLSYRLEQLQRPSAAVDERARKTVLRVAKQLVDLSDKIAVSDPPSMLARAGAVGPPKKSTTQEPELEPLAQLFIAGFADRLGRRNDDGSYALAAGFRAQLGRRSRCPGQDLLLAVSIEAAAKGLPYITAALPVSAAALPRTQALELRWDPERGAVIHEKVERLGALVLRRSAAHQAADPEAVAALLFAELNNQPERALNWDKKATAFAQRLRFCRAHGAETLPDPDDQQSLLLHLCNGRRSVAELRQADLGEALRSNMDYKQGQLLNRWAPEQISLPSGRRARVRYDDPQAPAVSARVQDFFGLETNPMLAEGRAAAVCHLLAPNGRPAQITADLAGFWDGSYAEVRKALRGRYPKHAWPENPRLGHSS